MKSHEMMMAYLKLSPEERHEFDRFYARRVIFLRLYPKLRRATPEQLQVVREILSAKNKRGASFAPSSRAEART
jgi:hypothetical protein